MKASLLTKATRKELILGAVQSMSLEEKGRYKILMCKVIPLLGGVRGLGVRGWVGVSFYVESRWSWKIC